MPFKDPDGRLVYVSSEFDRLLNSCEMFDRVLFRYPNGFSSNQYDWYLEHTLYFLESLDLATFREKAAELDGASREILLRNFDRLNLRYSDINLSQYVLALYGRV